MLNPGLKSLSSTQLSEIKNKRFTQFVQVFSQFR